MFRIRHAKTIASCAVLAVAALLFTLVLTHTGPAKPRPAPRPQISTEVSREASKPGNYATAINIHNPSLLGGQPITIYKRAVLAPPEDADPLPPSKFQKYSLHPSYAVEIDCEDIHQLLTGKDDAISTFIKGFVTILSRDQLDVVGVYTAEPPQVPASANFPSVIPGIALEMLPIAGRLEFVPGGSLGPDQGPGGRVYEYSAKFLCGPTGGIG
jgi:hypothetical protein